MAKKKHDHTCPQCGTAELLPGQETCQSCGLIRITRGERPIAVATPPPAPAVHAERDPETCTCGHRYRTRYPDSLDGMLLPGPECRRITDMAARGLAFYEISEATGYSIRTIARAVHFREDAAMELRAA